MLFLATFARKLGAKDKKKRVVKYRGRELTPNQPVPSDKPGKKMMVLASKNVDGKTKYKLVHYGASGYSDYREHQDKARRQRFQKRHKAIKLKDGTPAYKDRHQAAYWSTNKRGGTW